MNLRPQHSTASAIHDIVIAKDEKKKRYSVCLLFIHQVLKDCGHAVSNNDVKIFSELGDIAYGIDTYIDRLSFEAKFELLQSFPQFFDSLRTSKDEHDFASRCNEFVTQLDLNRDFACSLHSLYNFYSTCKSLSLIAELKAFSVAIIHSTLVKHNARNTNDVLDSLKIEGEAAVQFLIQFINRKGYVKSIKRLEKTHRYLLNLEKMLNLADELLDAADDRRKGLIKIKTNFSFYFTVSAALLSAFTETLIKFPFMFSKHLVKFSIKISSI